MVHHVPADIVPQLSAARAIIERRLSGSLLAIHLFGSAADGGLKPFSDIDLLVTVDAPPDASTRHDLMAELLDVSAWPGTNGALRALEVTVVARGEVVPWRHPARRELQFGEWLRRDLRAGIVEPPMTDPDLAILLTKARQHGIALAGPPAHQLFDPVPVADFSRALAETVAQWNGPDDWTGEALHIVLALARIWYSTATGRIASKDAAADWVLPRLPRPHHEILRHARAAYLGLEAENAGRLDEHMAAFVRHMKAEIENARVQGV